jgi:branched-chain amino acid transport system substrate-binding protein
VAGSSLTGTGAEWYQSHRQQFQAEPDIYAAYAYEAMNVALDAIVRAGRKDRATIRDALFATRDVDGILGRWSFTPTGDTTLAAMTVRQVRNGAWDDSSAQVIDAR